MHWTAYCISMLVFSAATASAHLSWSNACSNTAAESAASRRSCARSGVEHRHLLHHEHQLAGLRARTDDELSDPDARAGDTQLLVGAVGMALAVAFIRGIARREMKTLGNFWVDLTRATLWILLPISGSSLRWRWFRREYPEFPPLRHSDMLVEARSSGNRSRWQDHDNGNDADHRAGPGRFAGSDQDAGHQRRRLLQREQRASV